MRAPSLPSYMISLQSGTQPAGGRANRCRLEPPLNAADADVSDPHVQQSGCDVQTRRESVQ